MDDGRTDPQTTVWETQEDGRMARPYAIISHQPRTNLVTIPNGCDHDSTVAFGVSQLRQLR